MSFPKAKRFNAVKDCAPPPGAYDPKLLEKAHGVVVEKSERFKQPKDVAAAGGNVSTVSGGKTPVKQLFAAPQSGKKLPQAADLVKIKELEKEVRRLLKEQDDKERLLTQKEAEFKKHDGLTFKEITRLKEEVNQALTLMLTDLHRLDSCVVTLEGSVSSYNEILKSTLHISEKPVAVKRKDEGIPLEELSQKMKDEKLSFDGKLKHLRKKSENLQHRFQRALDDFSSSTKSLKARFTSVNDENSKLQKQISAAKAELQEALNVRTSLEERRDNLLDSNSCLQDQVKQMSAEQVNAAESLRGLVTNMEKLQEDNVHIQQQLTELQQIHDTTCRETEEKLHSIEMREVLANETTVNLHERIVELQAQNEDLASTLKETGELLSKTKEENEQMKEIIKIAEVGWEAEKKHFLIQVEELVFEKSKAEGELCNAEDKIKELENEIGNQRTQSNVRIDELTKQLEKEKAELLQLQNKLGDLVYEKSQLHTEVGHLEAQLKLVKSESEETACEANKAMKVVPELKKRIECLDIEKTECEKRIHELSEQNEMLQSVLEKLQADFDEHNEQVKTDRITDQEKIVALTEEVEGLKEQKERMSKELDDWLTDKSELDIEVAKLQCRINVLEMENEQVTAESEKEIESYKTEISRVMKEKQQIEKDMEQYGIDLLSNAAQLQSLQTKLNSTSETVEKLEAENTKLRDTLSQKDSEIDEKDSANNVLQQELERKRDECEELMNSQDKLTDNIRAMKEENEDFECRLQQTRADFIKRCDERDELVQTNEAKDKSLAVFAEQVTQLTKELESVNLTLKLKMTDSTELESKYSEQEKQFTLATQRVSNYKQQIEDYKEHLQLKCEECEELQQKCDDYDIELSMSAKEIVDLRESLDSLRKANESEEAARSELTEKYERDIEELKAQLDSASGNDELQAQLDKYKQLYEELQTKVEPFMVQIDAFEVEKQLLLGMNKDTQAEMERLGRNYAQLLGHQNQKQKIKHVVKIKNENLTLKKENQTLKEQVAKQKHQLQKLEERSAPKRLDPSKAFSHTKDNLNTTTTTTKSPLKQVNKK